MNNHEEDKNPEEPVLRMENEDLPKMASEEPASEITNEDAVEPEPEVEIDEADITVIDNESEAPSPSIGFPTRLFNAGDVIFNEGDPGDEAYLILNGRVKITRQHQQKRLVINQLGPDQIFGEMAIITGEPRTATAEAMEPTDVFIITENKLNENLSHNLAIVKNLIDQLIGRLKQLLKQQSTMVSKVERALLVDKKLEKIKIRANEYEQTKSPEQMEQGLKELLRMIREV